VSSDSVHLVALFDHHNTSQIMMDRRSEYVKNKLKITVAIVQMIFLTLPSVQAHAQAQAQNTSEYTVGPQSDRSSGLRGIVQRHAAANNVPFALADAVVKIESRYNPRASNLGNFGLMQIRLGTARSLGFKGSAQGLLDPETNARYGMRYLAQAYKLAGGDTCRTIMKYQSGHGATRLSSANRTYCTKARTLMARG
jgi:soluble lytic murein transglycosylase-like protein